MLVAIKLKAPSDPNGNPRRGWLVYDVPKDVGESKCLGWVEEEYRGDGALRLAYPEAKTLCSIDVPYAEYRRARTPL